MVYPDEEATLAMNHSTIDLDLDGPRPMPQKIRSMLKPDYSCDSSQLLTNWH